MPGMTAAGRDERGSNVFAAAWDRAVAQQALTWPSWAAVWTSRSRLSSSSPLWLRNAQSVRPQQHCGMLPGEALVRGLTGSSMVVREARNAFKAAF